MALHWLHKRDGLDQLSNSCSELVQFGEIIGGGGQGVVQSGKIKGQHVALKSCLLTNHKNDLTSFAKEVKLLRYLLILSL